MPGLCLGTGASVTSTVCKSLPLILGMVWKTWEQSDIPSLHPHILTPESLQELKGPHLRLKEAGCFHQSWLSLKFNGKAIFVFNYKRIMYTEHTYSKNAALPSPHWYPLVSIGDSLGYIDPGNVLLYQRGNWGTLSTSGWTAVEVPYQVFGEGHAGPSCSLLFYSFALPVPGEQICCDVGIPQSGWSGLGWPS